MAHPKGEITKPVALTPDVQAQIVTSLMNGNYLTTACAAAGITKWTFYHWKNRLDAGDPLAGVYADFFNAVERASAISEQVALGKLVVGSPGWQALAWFLERRFPNKWGKKDRTPVPPKPPKALEAMTPEELDAYKQSLGTSKG
jgi:hypothetical protein